jgi:hypothetical protein
MLGIYRAAPGFCYFLLRFKRYYRIKFLAVFDLSEVNGLLDRFFACVDYFWYSAVTSHFIITAAYGRELNRTGIK